MMEKKTIPTVSYLKILIYPRYRKTETSTQKDTRTTTHYLCFSLTLSVAPTVAAARPPGGSMEFDLWSLLLYLRIPGDRVGNRNSILETLCVSYGATIAGLGPTTVA